MKDFFLTEVNEIIEKNIYLIIYINLKVVL
jgi:hypothetical protein